MSSSIQLAAGSVWKLTDLKAKWLKYNSDSGYEVHVSQNIVKPRARYFSVCYSAPRTGWKKMETGCRAHLKALGHEGQETEYVEITSVDLTHTCGGEHKRKRNYRTKDISNVSDVLELYQPTSSRSGNAKQFQAMTKAATGMNIKSGQANLAV